MLVTYLNKYRMNDVIDIKSMNSLRAETLNKLRQLEFRANRWHNFGSEAFKTFPVHQIWNRFQIQILVDRVKKNCQMQFASYEHRSMAHQWWAQSSTSCPEKTLLLDNSTSHLRLCLWRYVKPTFSSFSSPFSPPRAFCSSFPFSNYWASYSS